MVLGISAELRIGRLTPPILKGNSLEFLHYSHLICRSVCGQIGNFQEIEPATQEILLSHGIYEDDFTDEVVKFYPTFIKIQ